MGGLCCLYPTTKGNMKKIFSIAAILLAACSLTISAASKKKAKKETTPAVKVDTVSMDVFSYAFGKANTNQLKMYLAQREGIDTTLVADFLAGFQQETMTESDKRMMARLAGVKIRQQVEERILPTSNKQVCDSVDLLNKAEFLKGFMQGVENVGEIGMDSAQAIVAKQLKSYKMMELEKQYGANRIAGEEFLKANAKKKGVVTLPSGLQYKVLVEGTGEKPTENDIVKVDYEGKLIDGTVFDESYSRGNPTTLGVNQVIKGWIEALQMMPVGSKWELYVPQELAYGMQKQGKIDPFSCLIFTIELHEIQK